jgi:nucleotide-binding universal stress UspA family protein
MPRELIVVGVDGSENSRQALRWTVEEARFRQARVRVVHAWWLYAMLAADTDARHLTNDASPAVQTSSSAHAEPEGSAVCYSAPSL